MIVSAPSPPAFFHNVLDLVRTSRVTRVAKTMRRLNEKEKEALQTKGHYGLQRGERRHLLRRQLKLEHFEVGHVVLLHVARRDRDDPLLHHVPQRDLSGALVVGRGHSSKSDPSRLSLSYGLVLQRRRVYPRRVEEYGDHLIGHM